ncbi:MAG TPA: GxxExxY protein [Rhodopila sp.]|jgi:GxxExxY protein|nr:GxxExxY protein [Rhodopila sp.]
MPIRSPVALLAVRSKYRALGPGLLEFIYETCLCIELEREGLSFLRQPLLPVIYKGQPSTVTFARI